jgi:hypothetical protein
MLSAFAGFVQHRLGHDRDVYAGGILSVRRDDEPIFILFLGFLPYIIGCRDHWG